MEQSWNPVNNYIYGPTVNSIYNQQEKEATTSSTTLSSSSSSSSTHRKLERILNINSINNRDRDRMAGERDRGDKGNKMLDGMEHERDSYGRIKSRPEKTSSNRRLLGEFLNNEAPKLCDHAINDYQSESIKMRHCTPLESYISTGRDMVCAGCWFDYVMYTQYCLFWTILFYFILFDCKCCCDYRYRTSMSVDVWVKVSTVGWGGQSALWKLLCRKNQTEKTWKDRWIFYRNFSKFFWRFQKFFKKI